MRRLLAAAAALVLLGGCGSDVVPTAEDLDGNSYESTEVVGFELVEGTTVNLTFEDGSLGAQAGCNTVSAAYDIDDDLLVWSGEPASTLMGCSEELTAQDAWLTKLFTEGVDVVLEDDVLTLTQEDTTIKLAEADE